MQFGLLLFAIFTAYFCADAVLLQSTMNNQYPQVAVLGCDSRKANLYYDFDRHTWIEHLASPCINNEQSILEFCQQAYPSLRIGNIVRLDTVLRFEDWCELTSPIDKNGNNIHRCKKVNGKEETVQPFRCLYMNSEREAMTLPSSDCSINSIIGSGECYRAEKWQQLASIECSNKTMTLNHSIMTLDWCGLSLFRGIEFVCCPSKKINENDYETTLDEQDDNTLDEDDPIPEQTPIHRRIIAMNLASREPTWMEDYRRWNSDPAYFADDEDTNDNQQSTSSPSDEQIRFSKVKEEFKLKYKKLIDQLRIRWQKRQNQIQSLSLRTSNEAQQQLNNIEQEFREEYEALKQAANVERTQINEIHENHLDSALTKAKSEANMKLNQAWNEKPLKTEHIQDALYNYLQILLRDRIHLVNRYERLRAVDPNQADRNRVNIHERLRFIVDRINEALEQLRQYSNFQMKIQPRIDSLFAEFDEVNQAAEKLLLAYSATSTTTQKSRILPLGRDAAKIYPFRTSSSPSTTNAGSTSDDTNSEYEYATNDEYDEDDDDNENDLKSSSSTKPNVSTTTNDNDVVNYDQGESDWDTRNDNEDNEKNESIFDDVIIDDQNQQAFINENDLRPLSLNKQPVRHLLVTYLPYAVGCLFLICLIFGLLIFRFIKNNRAYGNRYEKNYVFTEVDCCTPEEKALHALQMNGYENPTYKYFESQTGKC